MDTIKQKTVFDIIYDSKTVDWCVENTTPNTFRFENKEIVGYQRKISDSHIAKIIEYIKESWKKEQFYFPSCIVCSIPVNRKGLPNDKECFVVDGQHRIAAFRKIKDTEPEFYSLIKDFTLPVTILENVDELTEIQTFITINKTSRKVDTSLAMILKNKLADLYGNKNSEKVDFLAVELARHINNDTENNDIWFNQIAFEGFAKENHCLMSLNAFVKAQRRIIRKLDKIKLIDLDNLDNENVENAKQLTKEIFETTWNSIKDKWPKLFCPENISNSVILGPIGFTSLSMFVAYQLGNDPINKDNALEKIQKSIASINLSPKVWMRGEDFSKFSSEAGYAEIATQLVNSCT